MMNVLFYGNCQPGCVCKTLNLDTQEYTTNCICCFATLIDEVTFLEEILKSDIIITQNIKDNYRDKHYLSTSYIVNNSKKTAKIIIFDSCWFDFYYIDVFGMQNHDFPYHYHSMIESFKKNYSIEEYIEYYVNNANLKTNQELENIAHESLNKLNERYKATKDKYYNNENVYVFTICDYVKENYKKKLLFYSMNHPTKFVFQYISEEIINYLNIKNSIDYNYDGLTWIRCIMYKCIQNIVEFNICDYTPLLYNESDIYKITQIYYDNYRNNFFDNDKIISDKQLYDKIYKNFDFKL